MKFTIKTPLYISELGQRDNQEDAIYPEAGVGARHDRLFIVCDGMGGYEGGEIASRIVAGSLGQWFSRNTAPGETLSEQQLLDAITNAYNNLDANSPADSKMGTTLALLYFHRGGAMAAHIGDSRIYHIRPSVSQILYKSRDHSQIRELPEGGKKNIITRAIIPHTSNRCLPDITHITDIKAGDYFFLCSDGVVENLDDKALVAILTADDEERRKMAHLVEVTAGNRDNHSAYLVVVESVTQEIGDNGLKSNESLMSDTVIIPSAAAPQPEPQIATPEPQPIMPALPKSEPEPTRQKSEEIIEDSIELPEQETVISAPEPPRLDAPAPTAPAVAPVPTPIPNPEFNETVITPSPEAKANETETVALPSEQKTAPQFTSQQESRSVQPQLNSQSAHYRQTAKRGGVSKKLQMALIILAALIVGGIVGWILVNSGNSSSGGSEPASMPSTVQMEESSTSESSSRNGAVNAHRQTTTTTVVNRPASASTRSGGSDRRGNASQADAQNGSNNNQASGSVNRNPRSQMSQDARNQLRNGGSSDNRNGGNGNSNSNAGSSLNQRLQQSTTPQNGGNSGNSGNGQSSSNQSRNQQSSRMQNLKPKS